jgi:putative flippase GtrA
MTWDLFRRWLAFNGVGLLGVAVQLTTLAALVDLAGWHYLPATAIAVEIAVLHNFAWHQRWTWRDRPSRSERATLARLSRFHLLNGMVSLIGNLGLMAVLTGGLGLQPVPANGIAIVSCSVVNFVASEALVFRTAPIVILALIGTFSAPMSVRAADLAAELTAATVAAWQQYERQVDERYERAPATGDPFFAQDAFKDSAPQPQGWRQQVINGQVSMVRVSSSGPGVSSPEVPDGRVHHWVGAILIPNAEVNAVVGHLKNRAGRESEAYDDVTASKLLSREGDRIRVYMKLKRDSIITVSYNTEHDVVYRRLGAARASSRSVATKIAELIDAGTPREREKPIGNDNGFLWRLNAYWRFEQTNGGVLIECESVSLSRSVPALLRPFVTRTVERIARESLQKTLVSLRAELKRALPAAPRQSPH